MWMFFPIVMGLAYAAYFVFAGWICLIRKKLKWYGYVSASLLGVGFLCAFNDLEMNSSFRGGGLVFFFVYLCFSIMFSWIVSACDSGDKRNEK